MFKRTFMEAFKVRKNADITAKYGTVSTNLAIMPVKDRKMFRFLCYAAAAYLVTNATLNFAFAYELFYHFPAPASYTVYQSEVPGYVREANDEIIENWGKVHEARKLLKTFNVEWSVHDSICLSSKIQYFYIESVLFCS